MTAGEKSFTKTGRLRRASYAEVCNWVLAAWACLKQSMIMNGFRKAGIQPAAADDAPTTSATPIDPVSSSDSDSENENEADPAWLQLFLSDTEESDFSGFSDAE